MRHSPRTLLHLAFLALAAVLVLVALARAGRHVNSFAGPFIMYLDKSYQCDPAVDKSDGSMKIYVRPSHFRNPRLIQTELQKMTGNITFHINANDSFWIFLKVDSRAQNQWKENAFIFNIPGGGCTAMRTYAPDAYKTVFGRNPYSRESCLFPRGAHIINEMPLNFSFPKLAIMQYGYWRVQFTGGFQRRTTLCMMAEAQTLPKL